MKIGKIEGSPEEIRDFMDFNSMNISDFLEKPKQPLDSKWLVFPVIAGFACVIALSLISRSHPEIRMIFFLGGCGACIWEAVVVHHRFQSIWPATATGIGGLMIMLVALGILEPIELLKMFENFWIKE